MPDWAMFAAFAGLVTSALLLLSHASRGVISHDDAERAASAETGVRPREPTGDETRSDDPDEFVATPRLRYGPQSPTDETEDSGPSTALLLLNVAVSQGLFAALLLGGAWFSDIPAGAFGAGLDSLTPWHALLGTGFGVALYAANELGAAAGERFGLGGSEQLRESLAPETARGWAVLLLCVLPVIAGFEELLFRGALVGVVAAGFDVSPWAMAVVSSVAFALGHGAQGRVGVVVTGVLGFVLAAGFVLTGSLLVVFVAHYLVNALEFVVHEGLEWEWVGGRTDRR
ncbi:Membrane protease YdiL, CAAX protease family [Halopelagius inordinatus]|uniref:Membrane protease YdiL, CAAX protease family n=1 Tax=Halopelagius inordinatus TaxID=553467 RepID=A0A1I2MWL3_9EURY|nr:CPBP family intramembrane glutamic endopeptidase [Halopelagius inordinatus]SFF93521.1 Membrane protease YdiL, CAAX protease family [Halopelagius inordinatus]